MSEALNKNTERETEDILMDISIPGDAWDLLDALTGTLEGPEDWSEQIDYYLYDAPKQ